MDNSELLASLSIHYDMDFNMITLLREGGCTSYCVSNGNRRYFMKIIPQAFIDTAIQSFDITQYLEANGVLVPHIIQTKDGFSYVEVESLGEQELWVLFDFIDGREPEEGEDTITLGSLVGHLHSTMQEYHGTLPRHDKEFFIDRYINILRRKEYDEDKVKQFKEYGDYLWDRVKGLPRGFCHGDLHRGNLLRTSTGKYYLLDFDTSCYGFPLYDVAVLCNTTDYFAFDELGIYRAKQTYEMFLQGYKQFISLSDEEIRAFYDFIAIYHYQLQATIIELNGLECVDDKFLDNQLYWLTSWRKQCDRVD